VGVEGEHVGVKGECMGVKGECMGVECICVSVVGKGEDAHMGHESGVKVRNCQRRLDSCQWQLHTFEHSVQVWVWAEKVPSDSCLRRGRGWRLRLRLTETEAREE
jgi:hypothetical protein